MAAKKSIPVRVRAGTHYHREVVNGKVVETVYKAHETNNILFLGVAEAKELTEKFQNKFEILNEIEYKIPEVPEPDPAPAEEPEEESTDTGTDYGTEVTKSFAEANGTNCTVYTKDNLYTVIGPEGEVVKQGVSENAARKALKRLSNPE